ncbi:IS66-like element accessory protein TnpA [Hyphomonas atlantica]|uniref:IS66-like element accessory protein TnpA n=1 Tax=Hyphomonas atlantica TaxID=1280948 RepID=UPI003515D9BF
MEFHPSGHRTWSEEAKAHLVAQTLEPGATVKAVAERYGVLANQLSAWRRAAKDGALVLPSGAEDEAVFAPMVICDPEGPEAKPDNGIASDTLRIRIGDVCLELPLNTGAGRIAEIISALKATPC